MTESLTLTQAITWVEDHSSDLTRTAPWVDMMINGKVVASVFERHDGVWCVATSTDPLGVGWALYMDDYANQQQAQHAAEETVARYINRPSRADPEVYGG